MHTLRSELLDNFLEVLVHLLGVLGEVIPVVLVVHGLSNFLLAGKVLGHLLLDPAAHQHLLDPWDLEAGRPTD